MVNSPTYNEVSVYMSAFLLSIGVAIWVSQYFIRMFTSWGWAILFGFIFASIGYLMMYSDVRVYVGEKTMSETYLSDETDAS